MAINESAARARLADLRDTVRQLANMLDQLPAEGALAAELGAARTLADRVTERLGDLAEVVEGTSSPEPKAATDGAEHADFADAITSLAHAMVVAQRNLDRASLDYSRERSGDAARVPTSFRIPKLSAGFHFAIDRVGSRGLDLLLWHSNKETRERNQQSVSFDIVAVPPTAEFLATVAQGLPGARLLATAAERDPWLAAIRSQKLATMPARWLERVALAEVPRAGGAQDVTDMLAAYAEPPADPARRRIGLWRITRDGAGMRADTLVELRDYDAAARAAAVETPVAAGQPPKPPRASVAIQLLHDLVLPWCEAQAAFLARG